MPGRECGRGRGKKRGDAFDKGASSVIATRGGGIHTPLHVSMLIFLESKLFVVANQRETDISFEVLNGQLYVSLSNPISLHPEFLLSAVLGNKSSTLFPCGLVCLRLRRVRYEGPPRTKKSGRRGRNRPPIGRGCPPPQPPSLLHPVSHVTTMAGDLQSKVLSCEVGGKGEQAEERSEITAP